MSTNPYKHPDNRFRNILQEELNNTQTRVMEKLKKEMKNMENHQRDKIVNDHERNKTQTHDHLLKLSTPNKSNAKELLTILKLIQTLQEKNVAENKDPLKFKELNLNELAEQFNVDKGTVDYLIDLIRMNNLWYNLMQSKNTLVDLIDEL